MNKPIGHLEVKDGDKIVEVPYYHDSKMNCGCMTCKLANGEVSMDFYKGYFLGKYISELNNHNDADDKWVNLFFTDDEIADFIMNA